MSVNSSAVSLPLISVVITSHNYATFVNTAIDSVLSQNYPAKELIVVDDASTDSSPHVIADYGNQLTAVIKSQNGGHGAALNSGYAQAQGDIVIFLDADDFLLPGALERVKQSFATPQGAKVSTSVSMMQYRMDLVDAQAQKYDIFPKLEQAFAVGDQKAAMLDTGRVNTTVTSGLAFARSFLEQVMPMPPETFKQGGDGYLTTLAPLYGLLGDGGPEPVAAYRQHGQNHSGFGALIEKRALWCLSHDHARYDALRTHAARKSETPNEPLGWHDPGYLSQKMALRLFAPDQPKEGTRLRLSIAGLAAAQDRNLSRGNQTVLKLWWVLLGILPTSMAKNVLAWRLQPTSRPAWVKTLAKKLRRL